MKGAGCLQRLTAFDRKLVVGLALLVLLSFMLPIHQDMGAQVIVSSGSKTLFVAPLDQAQQVDLQGPLGTTVLQIDNGAARVLQSPCPQKICIGLGEARLAGDLLACVPNRLVVRIAGERDDKEKDYDLLSR